LIAKAFNPDEDVRKIIPNYYDYCSLIVNTVLVVIEIAFFKLGC